MCVRARARFNLVTRYTLFTQTMDVSVFGCIY